MAEVDMPAGEVRGKASRQQLARKLPAKATKARVARIRAAGPSRAIWEHRHTAGHHTTVCLPGGEIERAAALCAITEQQGGVFESAGELFVLFKKGLAICLSFN